MPVGWIVHGLRCQMWFSAATSAPGKAGGMVEQLEFALDTKLRVLWRSARVELQCLLLTQIRKPIVAGTIAGPGCRKDFE